MDQEFKKSPAFQFYPSDFLSDKNVLAMTTEEIGAYWLLVSMCWREGSLPNDLEELAFLVRMPLESFERSWKKRIERCFIKQDDGTWIHPRLENERRSQQTNRERRSLAGRKGNGTRWEKDTLTSDSEKSCDSSESQCDPNAMAKSSQTDTFAIANHRSSSSTASASSLSTSKPKNSVCVKTTDLGEISEGEPDHTHHSLLEYFQQKHVSKLKRQTNLHDASRLLPKAQALMRTHGREAVFKLVDRFFEEDRSKGDQWLQNADYSFNVFASQAERLVQSAQSVLSTEEIAKQVEAILAKEKKNERS